MVTPPSVTPLLRDIHRNGRLNESHFAVTNVADAGVVSAPATHVASAVPCAIVAVVLVVSQDGR